MGENNVRISFEIAPEHREETVRILSILGINNIEIIEPQVYNPELVDEIEVNGETIGVLTEDKMLRFGWRQEEKHGIQHGNATKAIEPLFRSRLIQPEYEQFHRYYHFMKWAIAPRADDFPNLINLLRKNRNNPKVSGSGIERLSRGGINFLKEHIKPFITLDASSAD